MEFLKKLNTVFLSLAVLLAVSCGEESKKEDPEPEQVQNPVLRTCQLTGQNQGGGFYNTYVNDSTGKIIRINYNVPFNPGSPIRSYYQKLSYNTDGNISEVKSYDLDNVQTKLNTYTYNADKLLETIKEFSPSANGTLMANAYYLFEYNTAKQLVKKSLLGSNQTVSYSFTQYSYPAPNQVKEEAYSRDASGTARLVATTIKQFDKKKSPYSLLNFYLGIVSLSKHNVIAHNETNHNTGRTYNYTYSYEYNEDGFPVKVTIVSQGNNFPSYLYWNYNCQ